jgi:very-short-patch-repair endonuclease
MLDHVNELKPKDALSKRQGPVEASLDRWRSELLDLSKSNHSLYFRPNKHGLRMTHPSAELLFAGLVNNNRSYRFFQPVVQAEQEVGLVSENAVELGLNLVPKGPSASQGRPPRSDEFTLDAEPKRSDAWLNRLRLKARSALQEQGVGVLFVAFGLLKWTESDASNEVVSSPLVMVPVHLERESALDPFEITALDEAPLLNPSLVRKLWTDFNLKFDTILDSEGELTLEEALAHVRKSINQWPRWSITNDAFLGIFSFSKYAMYQDLVTARERFAAHPVIRLLGGEEDGLPKLIDDLPTAAYLDTVSPSQMFQVLDADASQLEAIAAVKSGASLIIQGPPGTGKSQTIANLIAECIVEGKQVLFVSEKMAALRVVAKRLEEAGLREFCLEAHSQDIQKAAIIKDLEQTLRAEHVAGNPDGELQFAQIARYRAQLNAFVNALHDIANPLQMSVFQVHGEIASRQDVPNLAFDLRDIEKLTPTRLASFLSVVDRLVSAGATLLQGRRHPWYGCTLREFTPQIQAGLATDLRRMQVAADKLTTSQDQLRVILGLQAAVSLNAATWVAELIVILDDRVHVPPHWFQCESLAPLFQTADDYHARMDDYLRRQSTSKIRIDDEFLSLDLPQIQAQLSSRGEPYASIVLGLGNPEDRAIEHRADVESAIQRVMDSLSAFAEVGKDVSTLLNLPVPETVGQIRRLRSVLKLLLIDPRPTVDWFDPKCRGDLEKVVLEAHQPHEILTTVKPTLQQEFNQEFFDLASEELWARFAEGYSSWFRNLKLSYRRDMNQLHRTVVGEFNLDYPRALAAVNDAHRCTVAEGWFADHRALLIEQFGSQYDDLNTDWTQLGAGLRAIGEICRWFGNEKPSAVIVDLLVQGIDRVPSVRLASQKLERIDEQLEVAFADLDGLISLDGLNLGGRDWVDIPAMQAQEWLNHWITGIAPFWRAVATVDRLTTEPRPSVDARMADLDEAVAIVELGDQLARDSEQLKEIFGDLFDGLNTSWDTIVSSLSWTSLILQHFDGNPPNSFVKAFEVGIDIDPDQREQLVTSLAEMNHLLEKASKVFDPTTLSIEGVGLPQADLAAAANWAKWKEGHVPDLETWVDLIQIRETARETGLGQFVAAVERERTDPSTWRDSFLRHVYTLWISKRYDEVPALGQFRGRNHEDAIAQFRSLDRWQFGANARRIQQSLRKRRPHVGTNVLPKSEPSILLNEARKKRRFRPLRKLFADLPTLLPALKPCLLMSPLSVAQYLGESAMNFDVVIFDEASQILPADAIGSIGRGKQVVIVGDQQQLPPTRFFSVDLQGADDDEDEEAPESILDACLASGLPRKRLRWHYRSRHEDLIAFSNHHFYDGELITFPSPNAATRAVTFIHVPDGKYMRGTSRSNPKEALRVVDLIVEHVRQSPERTLGVITFSEAQMQEVYAALDARKRESQELEPLLREDGPEGFFIKNLENVQGDERDVIIFSVGYGIDVAGKMTMNFGPLNRSGGERRLNVAVTRARERVTIVASFQPTNIDPARTSVRGVHLLRRYLDFAVQGPTALLGEITSAGSDFESPFEASVAVALQAQGLPVVAQVGVGGYRIDLAIKDDQSDQYILGIECDGATYHSSKTARDRDRLRQQVLENLGWRIHRIWSKDWIRDPAGETQRVLNSVSEARRRVLSPVPNSEVTRSTNLPYEESSTPALPTSSVLDSEGSERLLANVHDVRVRGKTYQNAPQDRRGTREDFYAASIRDLAALIVECVNIEGPVHRDRAIRSVTARYGIARTGQRIQDTMNNVIRFADRNRHIRIREDFLWPIAMTLAGPQVRSADSDGVVRPIREVAPEEIGVAVVRILHIAFSISRADLVVSVARAFGYDRTGSHVEGGIQDAIDTLLTNGVIREVGGQISLSQAPRE